MINVSLVLSGNTSVFLGNLSPLNIHFSTGIYGEPARIIIRRRGVDRGGERERRGDRGEVSSGT